jgi:hypothetical protein
MLSMFLKIYFLNLILMSFKYIQCLLYQFDKYLCKEIVAANLVKNLRYKFIQLKGDILKLHL